MPQPVPVAVLPEDWGLVCKSRIVEKQVLELAGKGMSKEAFKGLAGQALEKLHAGMVKGTRTGLRSN